MAILEDPASAMSEQVKDDDDDDDDDAPLCPKDPSSASLAKPTKSNSSKLKKSSKPMAAKAAVTSSIDLGQGASVEGQISLAALRVKEDNQPDRAAAHEVEDTVGRAVHALTASQQRRVRNSIPVAPPGSFASSLVIPHGPRLQWAGDESLESLSSDECTDSDPEIADEQHKRRAAARTPAGKRAAANFLIRRELEAKAVNAHLATRHIGFVAEKRKAVRERLQFRKAHPETDLDVLDFVRDAELIRT